MHSFATICAMSHSPSALPWLEPGDAFPAVESTWDGQTDAPGLLAAGGDLSVDTLCKAYANGIFPWFSKGQPILWWSPDPRMVLTVANFRLRRSLRKVLARFVADVRCEIRFDTAFAQVISACAGTSRHGQPGTWIVPNMVQAYTHLHEAGHAQKHEQHVADAVRAALAAPAVPPQKPLHIEALNDAWEDRDRDYVRCFHSFAAGVSVAERAHGILLAAAPTAQQEPKP